MSSPVMGETSDRGEECLAGQDWLGTTPVFFDEKRRRFSSLFADLAPSRGNLDSFDQEGLSNFIDYGYSVFGKTPLKGVSFLQPNTSLWRNRTGQFFVQQDADPFFQARSKLSEPEIFDLLTAKVQKWERGLPGDHEIVLPLSGGFDSRLLLWALKDKDRIRAYTYGTSPVQSASFEVSYAKQLAQKFRVRWQHIQLGTFHRYLEPWNALFGLSVHAHGMYQMEFYSKIKQMLPGSHSVLSGIVGDSWAGSVGRYELKTSKDLGRLAYSHGLNADSKRLTNRPNSSPALEAFWSHHSEFLDDARYQVLTIIRIKMMLLSYLLKVPEVFGFNAWSPYLDSELALAMLDLKPERRKNRAWQRDFLDNQGLVVDRPAGPLSRVNNLNFQALRAVPLDPLPTPTLSQLFDPAYIAWVNRWVSQSLPARAHNRLQEVPRVGKILREGPLKRSPMKAYPAYLCLFPVAQFLK